MQAQLRPPQSVAWLRPVEHGRRVLREAPAHARAIYDRIATHLATLDGVRVDPVHVCIMWKCERSFAEVRAKKASLSLCFLLSRTLDDDRVARTLKLSANRTAHFVDLERPAQVDREVKGWLTEAWASSPRSGPRLHELPGRRWVTLPAGARRQLRHRS